MASVLAWLLFALGVAHLSFGVLKYRSALAGAISSGFVGRFKEPEERRTAFWFTIFALPLMLVGQIAVHAAAQADLGVLRLIGIYLLVTSVVGVAAFPRSPFWGPLLLAPFLVAVGYGLI